MRLLIIFLYTSFTFAGSTSKTYKEVFPEVSKTKVHKVKDTISKNPINTDIVELFNKAGKRLGFYRHIITTTGCDSACLPITVTLFYDNQKNFLKLLSEKGLTKKDHVSFTKEDYSKLEFILSYNPKKFLEVNHPKDMVDVITGATKKEYQKHVVKEAAYSSLRINLYNQDTLEKIRGFK